MVPESIAEVNAKKKMQKQTSKANLPKQLRRWMVMKTKTMNRNDDGKCDNEDDADGDAEDM